jgi:hypothetical protein
VKLPLNNYEGETTEMSRAISKGLALASIVAPFLLACGGGNSDDPTAVASAQCSGANCPGGPPTSAANAQLCPDTADIGNNTYLGGAGSGEIVSLSINATAMTYTLSWLESPIPSAPNQVDNKRQGVTITGSVAHPPAGYLPTAEQTRCAFILEPGTGSIPAAEGGGTYSTASTFNPQNPPMILVGQGGVAGGGIPGASIQYSGATVFGIPGVFPVTQRTLDFFPFIGFASVDTNLADLQGTYNTLAYHIRPSLNWATIGENAVETFDASGDCTSSSPSGCISTGYPASSQSAANPGTGWEPIAGASYFTSNAIPQILPSPYWLPFGTVPIIYKPAAPGYLVLGKVNGVIVPVAVRTGIAAPDDFDIDDESGIAILAPANALASGGLDGGFVGADSNFQYTAMLINGATGGFINPSTQQVESAFNITYGNSTPGIATVTDQQNNTGVAVTVGGLVAMMIQGTENGGMTSSDTFAGMTTSAPYFAIGAQVSK